MWKDSKSKRILGYPPVGLAALLGALSGDGGMRSSRDWFLCRHMERVSVSPGSSDVKPGHCGERTVHAEETLVSRIRTARVECLTSRSYNWCSGYIHARSIRSGSRAQRRPG